MRWQTERLPIFCKICYDKVMKKGIPESTIQLVKLITKPYRGKLFLFFFLSTLGTLAWTASPLLISELINKLSKTHQIDEYVWWLVVAYAVLRIVDEVLWRIAELVMRSFKPQMVESVRFKLFAAVHKKPYSFFVNSSSGRIGHWINQTTQTTNELVDTTIWTVWGLSLIHI